MVESHWFLVAKRTASLRLRNLKLSVPRILWNAIVIALSIAIAFKFQTPLSNALPWLSDDAASDIATPFFFTVTAVVLAVLVLVLVEVLIFEPVRLYEEVLAERHKDQERHSAEIDNIKVLHDKKVAQKEEENERLRQEIESQMSVDFLSIQSEIDRHYSRLEQAICHIKITEIEDIFLNGKNTLTDSLEKLFECGRKAQSGEITPANFHDAVSIGGLNVLNSVRAKLERSDLLFKPPKLHGGSKVTSSGRYLLWTAPRLSESDREIFTRKISEHIKLLSYVIMVHELLNNRRKSYAKDFLQVGQPFLSDLQGHNSPGNRLAEIEQKLLERTKVLE